MLWRYSVGFTCINKDGSKKEVREAVGTNLLEAAHKHEVDLEGTASFFLIALNMSNCFISTGACEASIACSTYVQRENIG